MALAATVVGWPWLCVSTEMGSFSYLQLRCVLDGYAATGGESFPNFSTDTYYPIWQAFCKLLSKLERDEEKCQALQRLLCQIATQG